MEEHLFIVAGPLPASTLESNLATTLIDLEPGTHVAHCWAGAAAMRLLLANSQGFGLLAHAGDMHGRNRGGRNFLTLDVGCQLLPPVAGAGPPSLLAWLGA